MLIPPESVLFLPHQGEHGLDEHKLHMYLSALQSPIPPLFAVVLQNAPFTSRAKLHGDVPAIEGTASASMRRVIQSHVSSELCPRLQIISQKRKG